MGIAPDAIEVNNVEVDGERKSTKKTVSHLSFDVACCCKMVIQKGINIYMVVLVCRWLWNSFVTSDIV